MRIMEIEEVLKGIVEGSISINTKRPRELYITTAETVLKSGMLKDLHSFLRIWKDSGVDVAYDDIKTPNKPEITKFYKDFINSIQTRKVEDYLLPLSSRHDKMDADSPEDITAVLTFLFACWDAKILRIGIKMNPYNGDMSELIDLLKSSEVIQKWAVDTLFSSIPKSMQEDDELKSVIGYFKVMS